jgi:cobalt-zinc-cadmium resistance protein CzcA
LNIEAYPDPTPPMVDIVTQSPGLSAEEIERYITIPIETQVAGLKNLRTLRTISLYGLSDVKLQFSFDYTYDEALQQVLNRLSQLSPLPGNVQPQISPLSPIGEIFRYRLVGPPNYSVLDLKTLQDWVLQRRFRSVPGVIDVTSWGGKTKTYELQVDFNKLTAFGLTLPQVLQAVGNANINVGGNTVNIGTQSAVVRGVGLIRSIDDLATTMISQSGGNPVLVRDIANVTVGEKPRLGIAGMNADDDIVQGIVLMRRGEQSSPTIARVEKLVRSINNSNILPPGVRIERIYDRKDLIDTTTHTVLHNMVVGILLIVLLQWLFLGNLRSAVIVGATIPFALFFAVIIMVLRGESANLLSVGAIDFGLIVDGTVIMVEAIFRRLSQTTELSASEEQAISPDTIMGMKSHAILERGCGRFAIDLLCGGDHHCGVPAAVHAERRRRSHLRADGEDLCICAGGRIARDLHDHTGAERDHSSGAYSGNRNPDHAVAASRLHASAALGDPQPADGDHGRGCARGLHLRRGADAWT